MAATKVTMRVAKTTIISPSHSHMLAMRSQAFPVRMVAELVHIHKSKLPDDSPNVGDTQPWTTPTNYPQLTIHTSLSQPNNSSIGQR
jgi:hypothetical protein